MACGNSVMIAHARLSATYKQAKVALASCERRTSAWANKAEALVSYAKMADDDSLRPLADRIQARAVHRIRSIRIGSATRRGLHLLKLRIGCGNVSSPAQATHCRAFGEVKNAFTDLTAPHFFIPTYLKSRNRRVQHHQTFPQI